MASWWAGSVRSRSSSPGAAEAPAVTTAIRATRIPTRSNPYWTSLWVRNARVPLTKVSVKSKNHTSYLDLTRASDGTVTDASGFGQGDFTLELSGVDGQTVTDTFSWPTAGIAGQLLIGTGNFP